MACLSFLQVNSGLKDRWIVCGIWCGNRRGRVREAWPLSAAIQVSAFYISVATVLFGLCGFGVGIRDCWCKGRGAINYCFVVYRGFDLIKIEFASLSHGQSTVFRIDWLLHRSCKAKLRISFWFITCCRNLEFESCAGWLLRRSFEVELRISFRFITCCRNLEFESCAGWLLRRSCKAKLPISFWFITCCRNLEFESCAGWLLRCSCIAKLRISFWFITCCRNLEFESCAGW